MNHKSVVTAIDRSVVAITVFSRVRRTPTYTHPGPADAYTHPGPADAYTHPGPADAYTHPGSVNGQPHPCSTECDAHFSSCTRIKRARLLAHRGLAKHDS